jgi:alpha-galactosidase
MKRGTVLIVCVFLAAGCSSFGQKTVWLDELDMSKMTSGYKKPQIKKSIDEKPLTIGGKVYERGVGTHSQSLVAVELDGKAKSFKAGVGVDDEVEKERGSVEFKIYSDRKLIWESSVLRGGDQAREVEVNLKGIKKIILEVTNEGDGINYDHADWADARIEYSGKMPSATEAINMKPYVLTPKAAYKPKINGPKVFGARPGSPFLYTIPATGIRPMEFGVRSLPGGLEVDINTGRITGKIDKPGEYKVELIAKNRLGTDKKEFKIVVGDKLALTPPMGWNSWNCWGCSVKAEYIKAVADAMADSGLINHGWTYVNIDDCWHGKRDPNTGVINSNQRFPDMFELSEYVHSKGLKIGLYTDCGPKTCAGYEGSEGHELQDMLRYAEWGFDYVKIDWCHCENKNSKQTYKIFGDALKQTPRDIVFSICNWGEQTPWVWGEEVGGNCWRTTTDITDTWESMAGIGFRQAGLASYAGPGHWNDPDMLVVGYVGWGPNLRLSRLSPDEQYTHISLWALLSSPLLLGCDLTKLDDFTLNLLTNDEVLAINQDTLGRQAKQIVKDGDKEVWAKELEDGSKAVGFFNRGLFDCEVSVDWKTLDVSGHQKVRDLWRQKDMGVYKDELKVKVPPHGVVLVKVAPVK